MSLHEAKALKRAIIELSRVPSQGDPTGIFDALGRCIPVVAGLVGVANPAAMGGMVSRPVRLPEELLASWMATPRERVEGILGPIFASGNGDFWRDRDLP